MKRNKLLYPFISFVLIALFSVHAAFVYQNIKSHFAPKQIDLPTGNWFQGIAMFAEASSKKSEISVTWASIPEKKSSKKHSVKVTKKIAKKTEKRHLRKLAFTPVRVHYAPIKYQRQAVKAVALAVKEPKMLTTSTPLISGAVDNNQLIAHIGFNWKVIGEEAPPQLAALWEKIQGEKALLALEVQRLAEENQARLALSNISPEPLPPTVETIKDSDQVSTLSSAPEKQEFRELVVQSDLEEHASINEVVSDNTRPLAESSSLDIASEQQTIWKNFKTKKIANDEEVSDSVASAIASAKKNLVASSFVPAKRDYSRGVASVTTQDGNRSEKSNDSVTTQNDPVQLSIQLTSALMGKGFDHSVHNFQFIPNYNEKEFATSMEGLILLENQLASAHGLISGQIIKDGYLPLAVDLSFARNEENIELNLPMIEKEQYGQFLDELQLTGIGAHLLVELSDGVMDAELDSNYEAKLYLNSDLKSVKEDEDYQFVLFVGAKIGNSLLSYINVDGQAADRIIFLQDAVVTYDYAALQGAKIQRFKLVQQSAYSAKPEILSINERFINYFNRSETASEFAPGVYDIKAPLRPAFSRNYYELRHLDGSIFVGRDQSKEVEVPSENLMADGITALGLDTLEGQCVIQLNLSKKAYALSYSGRTVEGGMSIDKVSLEKNGKWESEVSPITRKIFMRGSGQGVIDIKVTYLDDSVDYLQTFCSDSTYLVEQL